jgi:hypothetical protein
VWEADLLLLALLALLLLVVLLVGVLQAHLLWLCGHQRWPPKGLPNQQHPPPAATPAAPGALLRL